MKKAKEKAVKKVFETIAKTGNPTTQQLIFLQYFYYQNRKKD